MKKIYIHILNIVALILLTIFNLFASLGMNFTPLDEPLTAEYTHLASFYIILGVFYYLQLKQNALKKFLVLIIIEALCLYTWGLFGEGLLEPMIE
ncbi:hypothetical protein [Lentibacillus amyloliquefaciens]|uniref:Uncharacterized protein n=1 Tax=Lentibacillus amyloliquefaciens TaxID=1472767 RepID=A0A0U4FIC8_9BACI|nr:hypothetical protein [Lentibacillus amyloliquefaciens]ALX47508.1 hypothetical protein AOX59_02155 [Lentibacillus amyloliquefaciens]